MLFLCCCSEVLQREYDVKINHQIKTHYSVERSDSHESLECEVLYDTKVNLNLWIEPSVQGQLPL